MASMSNRFKAELECPVCTDLFQDPRTLDCGHTFCSKCLGNYVLSRTEAIRQKVIPCSICRHETRVPDPRQPADQWSKQLAPSITIRKLVEEADVPAETVNYNPNCTLCHGVGEVTPGVVWCSDCKETLCDRCARLHQVSSSLRTHQLNTVDSVVAVVKSALAQSRQTVTTRLEDKKKTLINKKSMLEFIEKKRLCTESNIRSHEDKILDAFKKKFQTLVDELNVVTEDEKKRLREEMKLTEADIQLYSQYHGSLEQVLESDIFVDIMNMHQFCEAGALFIEDTREKEERRVMSDVDFFANMDRVQVFLNENCLGEINVSYQNQDNKRSTQRPTVGAGEEWYPVLCQQVDTITESDETRPSISDITVVIVDNVETLVVSDYCNSSVKALYTQHNQLHRSTCKLGNKPFGITQLAVKKVMVTVPESQQLVTLQVTPDLVKEKVTETEKPYGSLSTLCNGHVVAGSARFQCVDVLDVSRDNVAVVRTLQDTSAFTNPWYLSVNKYDNILVSDRSKKSVTCLEPQGDILWTLCLPATEPFAPWGITTTRTGDVLVVDRGSNKVIVLKKSGGYKKDLLTTQNGICNPRDIHCDNRGYVYVVDSRDKILIYKVYTNEFVLTRM